MMSTHNIQFHDNIRKKSLNMCFLMLLEEYCRDSKNEFELAMIKSSVFELLRFDCTSVPVHTSSSLGIY